MSKHTPTPWSYSEEEQIIGHQGAPIARIFTSDDFPCVSDDDACTVDDEAEANARFIIRAVNSHEFLVALTKTLLKAHNPGDGRRCSCDLCGQARFTLVVAQEVAQ